MTTTSPSSQEDNEPQLNGNQDHANENALKRSSLHHTPADNILHLTANHPGNNNNNSVVLSNIVRGDSFRRKQKHVSRLTIPNIHKHGLKKGEKRGLAEGSDRRVLDWDNLGSPDENRSWSRSNRSDMMKSYKPQTITQSLQGVTTTEEMV